MMIPYIHLLHIVYIYHLRGLPRLRGQLASPLKSGLHVRDVAPMREQSRGALKSLRAALHGGDTAAQPGLGLGGGSRQPPAVRLPGFVGGQGGEWQVADMILPPDLGEKFKAQVLPQATLIAAAGQRHNIGDAGWEESAFAPMVAELKKWSAV